MRPAEVLRELRARGLSIEATGGDLRLQGPRERMDAELIGLIKANKPALLSYLDTSPALEITALQRGYLIGREEHVEIGATASHVYHEIEGCWKLDRLEEALRSVVARHGILRTRFNDDGTQVEQRSVEVGIGRHDLRGQAPEVQRAHRRAMREERGHRMLPADEAPLLAVDVTVLADDRMVLHVDHDGLILDAISMFLFFRHWWSAYEHGRVEDDGPEASFSDYVAAQERSRTRAPAERSRRYWLERLDDLAPHPDLPLRTSPSGITRPRFTAHFVRLDETQWTALKARAADAGLTPSGVLLAAYAETLAGWGAGNRFTLNTTVANRPPIHPRIHAALGNFGETMLVQVALEGETFAQRALAIQASLRESLDNRHFSGIEVLREFARTDGADARMPYTFNSAIGYDGADGSALELFGPEVWTSSQTPQVWLDVSPFEQHGGLVVQFDSVNGLFPDGLVEALVSGYQRLLELLLDKTSWQERLFDLLPEDQRRRRAEANRTEIPVPGSQLLQDAFLARAEAAPDAPAIFTSTGRVTYGELRAHAVRAAEWLRRNGIRRDEPVGLVMTRGPEQVAGILATVIAGAAYLPVDAALPAERREYLLRDSGARCVLTNASHEDGTRAVLALDLAERADPAGPLEHAPGASPDDLAYVLYTSGTTGEPKGVMVTHRNVANVVADCNRRFGIGPADRFFAISAFNFDLSVYDVFGALSAGAALVLPDAERAADPAHWLSLCGETGVTVWNSVPAIVSLLHEHVETEGAEPPEALRLVMMSGDRLPPALPAALRKLKPGLEVVSLGGPTETTIWNILHPVGEDEDGSESIPYGKPNANNRAYIVDSAGRDLPDWVTGEICAAGMGLARGYWGDPARTAERFFDDPVRGERLYRTGDLGRYLPSGEIEILGRTDFQIKVNGYRIEAGEVETRLVALAPVRHAVVARETGTNGDRLVAHLVPAGDERPSATTLGEELRRVLPHYMVPAAVYWHESLPLTRNGKVDRAKLLRWQPAAPEPVAEGEAADTELEREVAALWTKVLKSTTEPGATTTLFELGGDSLAAARILAGVRKRFGVTLTLDRLPEVDTVRTMAARIAATPARKGARR